jgi:hypothetical protein
MWISLTAFMIVKESLDSTIIRCTHVSIDYQHFTSTITHMHDSTACLLHIKFVETDCIRHLLGPLASSCRHN